MINKYLNALINFAPELSVRMWSWLNNGNWELLDEKLNQRIEQSYVQNKQGCRTDTDQFCWFGPFNVVVSVDFSKMETFCSHMICIKTHKENDLPDDHLNFKLKRENTWSWLNNGFWEILDPEMSRRVEDDYLDYLSCKEKGEEYIPLEYKCFGSGQETSIDFSKMQTYCTSEYCKNRHEKNGLPSTHLDFRVKRNSV